MKERILAFQMQGEVFAMPLPGLHSGSSKFRIQYEAQLNAAQLEAGGCRSADKPAAQRNIPRRPGTFIAAQTCTGQPIQPGSQ